MRIQPSPSASPDRSSPVGSLLGSPTLGVSRLVLAEDGLQGGSVMRIPRPRDSVGERAASSISPAQPDDDTEGSAKGPRPMPKRKRSKSENQSNQERHSPRRRPPAWVGASRGGEEDAALRADGEMDDLEMLREQQEMQSLEIGMMMKFQERRDEEETARSLEQLELIRCPPPPPVNLPACLPACLPTPSVMRIPANLTYIAPLLPDVKSCSLASPMTQLTQTKSCAVTTPLSWPTTLVPQRRAGEGI
jgi:hypothetical protein